MKENALMQLNLTEITDIYNSIRIVQGIKMKNDEIILQCDWT